MVSKSESVIFDFDFMKKFSGILRKMIAQDSKFGIALGGGYMMRKLRDIAKEAGISEDLQLHWIGTTYNNVNAEIVRAYMSDVCNARIVAYEDYYDKDKVVFEKCNYWRRGQSRAQRRYGRTFDGESIEYQNDRKLEKC